MENYGKISHHQIVSAKNMLNYQLKEKKVVYHWFG